MNADNIDEIAKTNTDCAICLFEFKETPDDKVTKLSCGHIHHTECL